ncbi:MAG: nuclease-related domain-containing protein [Gaiellaceae bacterium]
MRTPLLVVLVPMFFAFWVIVFSRKLDPWSVAAGALAATAMAFADFVRGEPPQHIQNWRRGAEGERKTERILRPLGKHGWSIRHDVQKDGRANVDHIASGPRGNFLLETKHVTGSVTVDDGCLVVRQFDDPDEVWRYKTLANRVRGQAAELSDQLSKDTGHRTWVQGVVVIWGEFPAKFVEADRLVYIHGEHLRAWLTSSRRPR